TVALGHGARCGVCVASCLRGQAAAGGAAVAKRNLARHRPHDSAAALLLLPCVRQNADGARQDEQTAAELGLEAEFAENDGGDAVDVHRYMALLDCLESLLRGAPDTCMAPGYGA